jgi:serpin B
MKKTQIKTLLLIIVFSLILLLTGCTNKPVIIIENNLSNQQTLNNSPISATTFNSVVDANNQFALDLYSNYKSKDGNMFFSPYSISSALAMTYEGANGRTAEEMQAVLHLPTDKELIHSGFANINNEINKENAQYKLSVANALWAQEGLTFQQNYLTTVDNYYSGKATNVNFKTDTEKSRITINNWVEDKTNNRIKDLIPKGVLTPLTRLVLTNAIYFKANWSNQFDAENTKDGQFMINSDKGVNIKLMHKTSNYNYGETKDLQILELNYIGDDQSMLILLPKENNINKIENNFTIDKLNELKKDMETEEVRLTLPKFKFETKYFMANDLINMGMQTAFSDNADFSGMTKDEELKISQVIHQTFIEVAENGTEAAAATAVIMKVTSAMPRPEQPKVFNADHPFIFIIQQKNTGNILFMGRLSDPSN